ncbi:hypothetical protein HYC85_013511 [Camellia sinensis]|uniref:PPM-type phosphatase domain-containing protein n=1 Tax=Camellia sinensis TaxID=4442 RepID=A0A7J7H6S4_CAMSI|nr:hypothetical protein HYC85_013511 [Camellia sinensis]
MLIESKKSFENEQMVEIRKLVVDLMVCNSSLRSVILQAGYIGRFAKGRVQLCNFGRDLNASGGLTYSLNRKFIKTVEMMVDSGATANRAPIVDMLPEKHDDGGYTGGGWKSEDGKLSSGYSSFRGKRASMEDFFDVKTCEIDGKRVCMFGVFDGETYQQTDMDFLESEKNTFRDDGSTASTAVLVGNHLYVANVGDSRTVISKAGKAIALSEDHKPNRSDERKRIESAGGVVTWAGTWRVGGVLAMSRAFGNRMLKQFVVAEPEIQDQEIYEEFELLVLASDGLWDVVPNEETLYTVVIIVLKLGWFVANRLIRNRKWPHQSSYRLDAVSLARTEEEAEAAARKLAETAYTRGSADNITCIVVKFHHDKADPADPQP